MRHIVPLLLCLSAAVLPVAGQAATYVVNVTDQDLPDSNVALAGCDANPVMAGDQCTLRAAVMQANAGAGADIIVLPLGADITLTIAGEGDASVGDLNLSQDVIITSIVLGAPADANDYPTITSNGSGRIFRVENNAQVELRGMQLIDGAAPALSFGGALSTLVGTQTTVDRLRFRENSAYAGGAVANWGLMTIEDSDFLLNASGAPGSSIYNDGILTLRRSSIRRSRSVQLNHAAIYADAQSLTTIENTLIDGNDSGAGSTDTGGIYASNPTSLIVRNSTLVDFTDSALWLLANDDSTVRLYNSVIVGDGSDDCRIDVAPASSPDIVVDYVMIPSGSDCHDYEDNYTLQVTGSASANLAALAGNLDSFVVYRRPLLNSLLVDLARPEGLGGAAGASCISTDQIGNPRPQDGDADGNARCDMGAIEAATQYSSTYVVNWYTQDQPDANPGDDICDADIGSAGPQCTLRAAVMEANAKPGPDIIEFQRDDNNDNTLQLTRSGAGGALWGDLDITEQLHITGNMENGRPITRVVGAMSDRLFDLNLPVGHVAAFNQLLLSGGDTTGYGGAIRGLAGQRFYVQDSELAANSAALGGGALYSQGIDLSVIRSDLHDNTAPTDGAALLSRSSTFVVTSSFWNNTTADAGQPEVIYIDDNGSGEHRISSTTISGNSGGILVDQAQHLLLQFATVANNDAYGLRTTNGGTIQVFTTILAGNGTADCSIDPGTTLGADHYNLIEDASCAVGGSNIHADPLLTPALWRPDYAISRAHVPMPGSPVIDAVPEGMSLPEPCVAGYIGDQFGGTRPVDSNGDGVEACEIGAKEFNGNANLAAEFLVNVVDEDRDDANPGDGVCDIQLSTPGPQCTLRAAIMESNRLLGHNYIHFADPGVDVVISQSPSGVLNDDSSGDLDILDGVTLEGFSASPASRPHLIASNGDRIFNVNAAGDTVSMADLIISGGNTSGSGGAIRFANISSAYLLRMRMDANSAGQGGGAISLLNGSLILDSSDLDNNAAVGDGSAIRSEGDLSILASSIRSNLDFDAASARQAIHVSGGGVTNIHNSTISDNAGMGVDIADGTLSAYSSTIADNSGHGIRFERIGGETLYLRHLLLNGNGDGGCQMTGAGAATISTNGYNISQSYGCDIQSGGSNLITGNVSLLPLAIVPEAYTAFQLLGPGSVAIDSGSLITGGPGGCETDDQHGIARPLDGDGDGSARCDAGAIEMAAWPDGIFSDGFED